MEHIEIGEFYKVRIYSEEMREAMGSVDKNILGLVQDIIYDPILYSTNDIQIWNLPHKLAVGNVKPTLL